MVGWQGWAARLRGLVAERRAGIALVAIWALGSFIAIPLAMIHYDSAFVDGSYLPRSNDSFYHASRILEAAQQGGLPRQFDTRLHVPEGAWIPWPWGYDYLMAKVVRLGQGFGFEPMAVLSYAAVAWVPVNAALFLGASYALGLPIGLCALGMLCFALSPLTQSLHQVGMLDHHYAELTFVLLTIWLGLRWFERTEDATRAALLGGGLGLALAVHNGLFILQIPVILTVLLLWLRDRRLTSDAAVGFSASLLGMTFLVLLPSEPFRQGMFEFGLTSWFHAYIACSTVLVMIFMAATQCTRRSMTALLLIGTLLVAPLALQVASGAGFISGQFSDLGQIAEVMSPYRLATETMGWGATLSYYSALLLFAPFLLLLFTVRTISESDSKLLFFSVYAVLGIGLLLAQFRFHPFGTFPLWAGTLLLGNELRLRANLRYGIFAVTALAVIAVAYQPPLRLRLFTVYAPAGDARYALVRKALDKLADECVKQPGIALAHRDDGNAILYGTQCSVLVNNFILRPEDDVKSQESRRLLLSPPGELLDYRPAIRYVLVRADLLDVYAVEQADRPGTLVQQLLVAEEGPAGFELLYTVKTVADAAEPPETYARLYRINSPENR